MATGWSMSWSATYRQHNIQNKLKSLHVLLLGILDQPVRHTEGQLFWILSVNSIPVTKITLQLFTKSNHSDSGADRLTNFLPVNLSENTFFQLGCVFSESAHQTNHFDRCQFCSQKAFAIFVQTRLTLLLFLSPAFPPQRCFSFDLYRPLDEDCYFLI